MQVLFNRLRVIGTLLSYDYGRQKQIFTLKFNIFFLKMK